MSLLPFDCSLLLQFNPSEVEKKYGSGWATALFFGYFIVGAIILVLIMLALNSAAHRRRRQRRQEWGRRHGLKLLETPEMDVETDIGKQVLAEYPYVSQFKGNAAMAMHILVGEFDRFPTRIFEYRFITGSGKSTVEHHYTCIAFHFETVRPYTAMRRHGWLDGLPKEDLKTGREALDKAFYIYADDWKILTEQLTPEIERLLLDGMVSDLVQADKSLVLMARGRLKNAAYDEFLGQARRLVAWFASRQ